MVESYRPKDLEKVFAQNTRLLEVDATVQSVRNISVDSDRPLTILPIPRTLKPYVESRDKNIFLEDLDFFNGIVERHGSGRPRDDDSRSDQDAFVDAAEDIVGYAMGLREDIEEDITKFSVALGTSEDKAIEAMNEASQLERQSPSSVRMHVLSKLFLNHPQFRGAYLRLHASKMMDAHHILELYNQNDSRTEIDDINWYMDRTSSYLNTSLNRAVQKVDRRTVQAVGFVMGLHGLQGQYSKNWESKALFTHAGTETFVNFLRDVVSECRQTGNDVSGVLGREIHKRDGVGFQLMHTNLFDLDDTIFEGMSMDEQRDFLQGQTRKKGNCPATLKMPSSGTIAYALAYTLVGNIPQRLLRPEN